MVGRSFSRAIAVGIVRKRVRDGERAAGRAVVLQGNPVDRVVGVVGDRAGRIRERERVADDIMTLIITYLRPTRVR